MGPFFETSAMVRKTQNLQEGGPSFVFPTAVGLQFQQPAGGTPGIWSTDPSMP